MLSDADRQILAEARRLDAERSRSPWVFDDEWDSDDDRCVRSPDMPVIHRASALCIAASDEAADRFVAKRVADAAFIAHCGTHQTRLLEIVAELEREVERLKAPATLPVAEAFAKLSEGCGGHWDGVDAEKYVRELRADQLDHWDFMAFMKAELAKFPCLCEDGKHADTAPMFWPELMRCIIKRAVRDAKGTA